MKIPWIACIALGCVGLATLSMGQEAGSSPEKERGAEAGQSVAIAEEESVLQGQPGAGEDGEPALDERAILISLPDVFGALDRPPVRFFHGKHTTALEKEGCEKCHPRDETAKILFLFPKEGDESDRDRLMDAYHNGCIGCHQEMRDAGKEGGPLTCGECHVILEDYRNREYLPILPEYYDALRDTYHRECVACHHQPEKVAEDAGDLGWKGFYLKEQARQEEIWPRVSFDHYLHDKHSKTLEEKCELCHTLSPERERQLAAEGKEPACRDWLQEIDEEQSLTREETAHARCLNCHLERKDEGKDAGPVYCKDCHTGKERTAKEMADVPRIDCGQEEKLFVKTDENARAEKVPFNHQAHQENTRSCQECHHQTLRPCVECHTLAGAEEEGGGITLAEAYHEVTSAWSCIGCHETKKDEAACSGCHHLLGDGLVASTCNSCHAGSLEPLGVTRKLPPPGDLLPDDTKEELEIAVLEKEYESVTFPHTKIVEKLTAVSNENRLASYFHVDATTLCSGCHHYGPVERKTGMPPCGTCHTARREPDRQVPALLGAYHQQCLGCHRQTGGTEEEMPRSCTGCHEEKKQDQEETTSN